MSNDLLFSILPREGKVPVKTDDRVKQISKENRATGLGDEEKEEHQDERQVSKQEQYKRIDHKDGSNKQGSERDHQEREPGKNISGAEQQNDEEKNKQARTTAQNSGFKHLDIYI